MKFQNTGYYYLAFLVLAFVGFWPSYFSKFFDGTADFNQYFQFHVVTAILWVGMLVIQPILIRGRRFALHRTIGKFSYFLVPILFISVLLLANNRISPELEPVGPEFWIPFKDLLIFSFGFGVAIWYRHSMTIHARGMIVAGLALFEPVMVRVMYNVLGLQGTYPYILGISLGYVVLMVLIFLERNEKQGRWVFPVAFFVFLFVHIIRITGFNPDFWERFSHWFVSLPLT